MNDATPASPWLYPRLRSELMFGALGLGFGVLVLPALVYWVGLRILGPYPDGGIGSFYAGLLSDLASGSGRAWLLVAGPYATLVLLRLLLFGWHRAARDADSVSRIPRRNTG